MNSLLAIIKAIAQLIKWSKFVGLFIKKKQTDRKIDKAFDDNNADDLNNLFK